MSRIRLCGLVVVLSMCGGPIALDPALSQEQPQRRPTTRSRQPRPTQPRANQPRQTPPRQGSPSAAQIAAEKEAAESAPSDSGDESASSTDVTKRGRDLINKDAFGKTRTARSMADYTAVIETCQKGLAAGVDKDTADYAASLMAWAHNRRGETMLKAIGPKAAPEQRAKADQESLAEFEAAINLDAKCWRAFHNRGVSLAQMRDFAGAIKDFDRAIEINGSYADAWYNRGELKFGQRKYDEAIADFNEALRLAPNDAVAYTSRGHARWAARQHEAAVADYDRAIQLAPRNALAYTNRGMAYTEQGLYDRAALDFRKAIELDAELGRAYQGAAWLMATCPDERFRDVKKAVEAATKALEIDGWNDFRYIDTLAAAYANAGRYDAAQKTIAEAIKHAPTDKEEVLKELTDRQTLYDESKPYRDAARVTLRGQAARR